MQEIIIEIDETAAVKVSVRGVKGKGCKLETIDLERALGTTTEIIATAEAHQTATTTQDAKLKH